jgi:hypothetical protein
MPIAFTRARACRAVHHRSDDGSSNSDVCVASSACAHCFGISIAGAEYSACNAQPDITVMTPTHVSALDLQRLTERESAIEQVPVANEAGRMVRQRILRNSYCSLPPTGVS